LAGCSCFHGNKRFSQNIAAFLLYDQVIHRGVYLLVSFGASDATIFSKRGSDYIADFGVTAAE
jgi:hypothetical protein